MRFFNKTMTAFIALLCCVQAMAGTSRASLGLDLDTRGETLLNTVTYKVVFGRDTVKTFSTTDSIGADAALPDSLLFGNFAEFQYSPEKIDTATRVIVATMTWNPSAPIQFSDENNQYWYSLHIKNANTTAYFNYVQGRTPNIQCDKTANDANGLWAFFGNPYAVRVRNKAAGRALQLASPSTKGHTVENGRDIYAVLTDNFQANPDSLWRLLPATKTHKSESLSGNGFFLENQDGHKLNIRNKKGSSTYYLAYWTQGYDKGSTFIAERPTKKVVFKVMFDGQAVKTAEVQAPVGTAVTIPTNLSVGDFASFTYSVDTVKENTDTVVATMKWNPYAPIQFSSMTGERHYYALSVISGGKTVYYNYKKGDNPNITCDANAKGDSCQWAFFGNPYAVRIMNKAAGDTLWLASPATSKGMTNAGGNAYARLTRDFTTYPDSVWRLYPANRTHDNKAVTGGGFYLENAQGFKLNYRSPHLAYWTDGYDQGSAFIPAQMVIKPVRTAPVLKNGVYHIKTVCNGKVLWAGVQNVNGRNGLYVDVDSIPDNETWRGHFLLRKTGDDTYSVQDLETGLYISQQAQTESVLPTGSNAFNFTMKVDGDIADTTQVWWNIFNNASADKTAVWHADASGAVYAWRVPTGTVPSTSDWLIERDSVVTDEMISARLSHFTGITAPRNGGLYRLVSVPYGRALYDNYTNPGMECATMGEDRDNNFQVYRVDSVDINRVKLRNIVTDKYIQAHSMSQYYTMTDSIHGTTFTVNSGKSDDYTPFYYFVENGGRGMHCAASQNHAAVSWSWNAEGNRWYVKRAAVNDSLLAVDRARYRLRTDLRDNASKYGDIMYRYFEDYACTRLKKQYQDMDSMALRAEMNEAGLATVFQDIVFKIKNRAWAKYQSGRDWEKYFRIAQYKPYTDTRGYKWSSQIGIGYLWGNMTGPTGITTDSGESMLYVFLDSVPTGAYMAVQVIPLGTAGGTITPLRKGLNTVLTSGEGSVFVYYWVDTSNGEKYDGQGPKLSDFPDVTFHIEGGFVNGMFDTTRGMTDSMYTDMYNDGLITARAFDTKGKYCAQHWRSSDVRRYKRPGVDGSMEGVVKCFDDIIYSENSIEGFCNDSFAVDRFNGLLEMTAVDHNYMYASTYGCYVNWSGNMDNFLHFDDPNRRGDSFWGVAHEFGHNHQNYIHLAGSTETSVNFFTLVAQFELTPFSSRYAPETSVANMADFLNRDSNNNWWNLSAGQFPEMLYKLYLYYHAAGNDTTFYPKVFRILKRNSIQRGGNQTGRSAYMNLALACSEAAGENLEDFFRVFGMFNYVGEVTLGDYGRNCKITVTQDEIDDVLAEMRKYPKKGGGVNALFACDDIRTTKAIYPGNKNENRTYYPNGRVNFGQNGNEMGNWDSFRPDSQYNARARFISATEDEKGNVIYSTEPVGSISGYKVYDGNGKLIWFANTHNFTVPKSALDKAGGKDEVYVVACATNGTEDYVGSVKVDVPAIGYASLYYGDRNLRIPEGVTAQAYGVENNVLKMVGTTAANGIIPQATGVVLKAPQGSYRFEYVSDEVMVEEQGNAAKAGWADEANLLLGTDTMAVTTGADETQHYLFYKLSRNSRREDDSFGFYWGAAGGSAFTNNAHKAYLAVPAGTQLKAALPLADAEAVTGITSLPKDSQRQQQGTAYNLSGQRVGNGYKGIVICDGKKVLKK